MKKLFFIFAFLPLFAFGGTARVKVFTTGTNTTYTTHSFEYVDELYTIYFNTPFALFTGSGYGSIVSPVPSSNASSSVSKVLINQISFGGGGSSYTNSPSDFASVNKIFVTASTLLSSGYSGAGVLHHEQFGNRNCFNIDFRLMVQDVLSSTNTLYHSILLSSLASINSSINNIRVDLGQFQTDYQTVNSGVLNVSNYIDSAAAQGVISEYQADLYKQDIASAHSDPYSFGDPNSLARSVYDSIESLKNTISHAAALNSRPDSLNEFAKQFGNSFSAAGAGHYTTPLTNEMQRMTTNWVQETKAALSNNTQKIKDDLQAWKDQLSGPNGSQAAIVSALNGAINSHGSVKVEVQNSNNELHVNVNGPVELKATQFNDINNKLQANFDQFHDWVYDIPESWVRYFNMFRDNSTSVLTNQSEQISLLSSLTNLLFDYTLNFTSNTMFAISNSFAGITATNDYMLLSDYVDYINTSGLSDLLGVLDDDSYSGLKDELFSIGSDDVSAGYGRWWRFYTGLSTIQANSAFKIANLLLDHEKLLKDLKRDNTDVLDLSDSSVFSELLSKIPSQTDIDDKISQLTNSIDQSGFARIRELIPDLTNRLSVASALYDHDFALPTDISWVLIPADSELNIKERVVHISPSEHYRVFQVLHYGIAFSYCIVNLILLPKFLLLLVRLFDRVWNKSERLIYNSTQS